MICCSFWSRYEFPVSHTIDRGGGGGAREEVRTAVDEAKPSCWKLPLDANHLSQADILPCVFPYTCNYPQHTWAVLAFWGCSGATINGYKYKFEKGA